MRGRSPLLFDCDGNHRRNLRYAIDCFRDLLDRQDRLFGSTLNRRYLLSDLAGRLCRLLRPGFHFGRNDGKSSTGLAYPYSFDCGVEGKKIGLRRDRADDVNYISDALCGLGELYQAAVHLLCLRRRLAGYAALLGS